MAVVERLSDLEPEKIDAVGLNTPARTRLLIFQRLLHRHIEQLKYRKEALHRLERLEHMVAELSIAEARLDTDTTAEAEALLRITGDLHSDSTIIRNRKEAVRIAKVQYDSLIYPLGVTSETAAATAPTFMRSVDEAGKHQIVELDPSTLEPLN